MCVGMYDCAWVMCEYVCIRVCTCGFVCGYVRLRNNTWLCLPVSLQRIPSHNPQKIIIVQTSRLQLCSAYDAFRIPQLRQEHILFECLLYTQCKHTCNCV